MRISRSLGTLFAVLLVAGTTVGTSMTGLTAPVSAAPQRVAPQLQQWPQKNLPGNTRLTGQVPREVAKNSAHYLGPHNPASILSLNFGLPLFNVKALNAMIMKEAITHRYMTRAQIYARFSPSVGQFNALRSWLVQHGFAINHVSLDRLSISARASTAHVESVLSVRINNYRAVHGYTYYSNTAAPLVPRYLGLQTISGLNSIDRFHTNLSMVRRAQAAVAHGHAPGRVIRPNVRIPNGYYPADLQQMYDVPGHGFDGSNQTIGFTLWGYPLTATALTRFQNVTGDQQVSLDTSYNAQGTCNASVPANACSTHAVPVNDEILFILENGNNPAVEGDNDTGVETSLDVEYAHAMATHARMKYYLGDCTVIGGGCSPSEHGPRRRRI